MLLTIIIFILILGLLILSHEFGHFISAKKSGMKVEEFGIGFPPRLFSFKKGETLYSINLIPLGGFVKIFGEQKPEKKSIKSLNQKLEKRAFFNKPIWQRAIVLVMGVVMNFLVAVILLSIVHGIGVPTILGQGPNIPEGTKNIQIQILQIANGSPAKEAGIKVGDIIKNLSVDNYQTTVKEVGEVQEFIDQHVGEKTVLTIQRGKEILKKDLIPRISPPKEEGPLGIALAKVGLIKYPWYSAILRGFKTAGELLITFAGLFYDLFKTLIFKGTLMNELAGPIGIATLVSQATKLGIIYLLQFTAIISINLVIINILPFPALDGGRLLFLAIEKIKGSPLSAKIEGTVNTVGFALLIILMILVTFRDISRIL